MTDGTEQCRFERPQMKVFEKTVQKQATLWITVGKRTGFEPLFGPLVDTFLNKSLKFLISSTVGILTQVATSRPCRARCI